MKSRRPEASVESVLQLLRRSRLLTPDEVDTLEQRWHRETAAPGDLAAFSTWLVKGRYVTDYQMEMLLHGRSDRFFLGEYKLLQRIGRGRLTMVYKGVDRVGRLAALKVLPPSRAREQGVLARFRHEQEVGKRLDHPHLVRIHEIAEDDGLHYLVMEYLEGETLEQRLARRGRLTPLEAADLIAQACVGLQYLHQSGLLHRNLEPANLLLVQPPDTWHRTGEPVPPPVKILDLTLVRAAHLAEELSWEDGTRMSHEGLLLALPAYLAPELARPPHLGDIRSDVYSLGCILYHALAGRSPFDGVTSLEQVVAQATRPPTPLAELDPELPVELVEIVGRMMASDPQERPATPQAVGEELKAFVTRQSVAMLNVVPVEVPAVGVEPLEVTVEPVLGAPMFPMGELDEGDPFALGTSEEAIVPAPSRLTARAERKARGGLGRRDWLLLLLGAGSLLVVQTLAWLLGRLVAGR